jgi:MYXO-CTERM domain-containing protein
MVALFAGLLSALFINGPVRAHGGAAGLEVIPSRVAAGNSVRLVGDDFEGGDRVRLTLLTGDGDVVLGEVVTDADGHITIEIVLPAGLDTRPYEVRATDSFGDTVSGYVTVVGTTSPTPGLLAIAAAGVAAVGGIWLLRRRRSGHPASSTRDDRRFPL